MFDRLIRLRHLGAADSPAGPRRRSHLGEDYDRAEAMLREGLASAEEAADRPLASEVRAVLGRLDYYRGDLAAVTRRTRKP